MKNIGRYVLEAELGSGGMGEVYRGMDTVSGQPVAIKQLKAQIAQPDNIERFKREGEALRDLNHPNIVKMLDAIEDEGNHYLVMEYVSGGDLASLLQRGKMPLEQLLKLAIDLADALTRAHKLNIIHRDLKPANVLIGDDGVLRLTDFGVARVASQQRVTDTDAIVGTIDYLPPEAFSGNPFDARGDIWAFGVMLFEMLAGQRPFTGGSVVEVIYTITTQAMPDLEALCPDAPVALVDLIYRMLERDANARIASIRHVGAALEDILQGRDTTPLPARFAPETPTYGLRGKHNLPAQTTPFVGREHELEELARLIQAPAVRLMTILAPGGMGKTRLSLAAAEGVLPDFADGVYFVELAPLSDPANILSAVANATEYPFQSDGRTPRQQLLDFLSEKRLLLVMDNFEHLLEGADLMSDILGVARQVKILATSRERLNLQEETLFRIEGMDFPDWETPEDALEYSAVKLFMQSARRVRPDFELKADDLRYVARICRMVQGMPLGIVLAAAWVDSLSLKEITEEITRNVDFLETEARNIPERHRSIRAVFDYSWNLLSESEREIFMKLSVFRGGFTREAAEAVTGATLRTLMSLMNKSLIRRNAENGRYDIHELTRQYSESKLVAAGEWETTRETHARFFVDFITPLSKETIWCADNGMLEAVLTDMENLQTGWRFLVERKDTDKLPPLLDGLWIFFDSYSRSQEGVELFEPLLKILREDGENSILIRGKVLGLLGWLYCDIGARKKARQYVEEAISLLEPSGTTDALLQANATLAILASFDNEMQRKYELEQKGLDSSRQLNNSKWEGIFSFMMGLHVFGEGRDAEALELVATMPEKLRPILLVSFLQRSGDYEDAKTLLLKQLSDARHHSFSRIGIYRALIENAVLRKDFDEAWLFLRRGLQTVNDKAYVWAALDLLTDALTLLIERNNLKSAVEILSFILNDPTAMGGTRKYIESYENVLKEKLPDDVFTKAWKRGASLDFETIVQALLAEFGGEDAAD